MEYIIFTVVFLVFSISYLVPYLHIRKYLADSLISGTCTLVNKGVVFQSTIMPFSAKFSVLRDRLIIADLFCESISYLIIIDVELRKNSLFMDSLRIKLPGRPNDMVLYTNKANKIYDLIKKIKGVRAL